MVRAVSNAYHHSRAYNEIDTPGGIQISRTYSLMHQLQTRPPVSIIRYTAANLLLFFSFVHISKKKKKRETLSFLFCFVLTLSNVPLQLRLCSKLAIGSSVLLVPKDESGFVTIINLLPVPSAVSVKCAQHVAWCSLAQNSELYTLVTTDCHLWLFYSKLHQVTRTKIMSSDVNWRQFNPFISSPSSNTWSCWIFCLTSCLSVNHSLSI